VMMHASTLSEIKPHRPLTRLLHWCVFVLVLVAAASIITRGYIDSSPERKLLLHIHHSAGLAVLGLMLARLAWRLIARVGALQEQPLLVRIGATFTHTALYLTLFALPILGWLTSDAFGQQLHFLGAIQVPALIGRNRGLGDALQDWHCNLAWLLLTLVSAHIGAALWHHFLRGDGVLRSMAPFFRRPVRDDRATLRLADATQAGQYE
jgi:cytochrome b561